MLRPRRVLVVAGGEWQVPIVRKVTELGLVALCSNLYPDSPAFQFAREHLVADVRDRATHLDFARSHSIDAVITDQSDIAVPTVAYLCEKLGLPGIGPVTAELFTNKARMREFCRANGFPCPEFRLCSDVCQAEEFATEIGYPCVVKPPNSQSSRGVAKVGTRAALERAFEAAVVYSSHGSVLIERFIGGVELTVEGLKHARGHCSLAVSRKTHYAHNPMVASRLFYSPSELDIDYDRLRAQHDQLVCAMGLPFGITHAEYKFFDGQFYLIEVAARGGGTLISSDIVPRLSGLDTNALLIRMALGEQVELIWDGPRPAYAALDFWEFAPGRIREIHGLDEVRGMPGVLASGLTVRAGQELWPAQDDRTRHGFVIVFSETRKDVWQGIAKARSKINIAYQEEAIC